MGSKQSAPASSEDVSPEETAARDAIVQKIELVDKCSRALCHACDPPAAFSPTGEDELSGVPAAQLEALLSKHVCYKHGEHFVFRVCAPAEKDPFAAFQSAMLKSTPERFVEATIQKRSCALDVIDLASDSPGRVMLFSDRDRDLVVARIFPEHAVSIDGHRAIERLITPRDECMHMDSVRARISKCLEDGDMDKIVPYVRGWLNGRTFMGILTILMSMRCMTINNVGPEDRMGTIPSRCFSLGVAEASYPGRSSITHDPVLAITEVSQVDVSLLTALVRQINADIDKEMDASAGCRNKGIVRAVIAHPGNQLVMFHINTMFLYGALARKDRVRTMQPPLRGDSIKRGHADSFAPDEDEPREQVPRHT